MAVVSKTDVVLQAVRADRRARAFEPGRERLLTQQDRLNKDLGDALEARTRSWGVHIQNVEIRTVDLDPSMFRAMAQEAEAARGARARIITAAGEFDAAENLAQAADVLSRRPRLDGEGLLRPNFARPGPDAGLARSGPPIELMSELGAPPD